MPLSVVTTLLFEAYEAQYVYTLCSEMAMFSANATLFYLLYSPKSSYRKSSTDDVILPHNM